MTDLTDLHPEDVRGHLYPDGEGIDPDSLTVGELRYAARVYLDSQPHQRPLHRDELIAVYEALTNATLEGLGVGFGIGRLLSFSYPEVVCFNNIILSRNSPTALAIAVVAFPNDPLIPLALVIGPLLELPLLGIIAQIHIAIRDRNWWPFDPMSLLESG